MRNNKLLNFTMNHYLLIGIIIVTLIIFSASKTYAKYIVQTTQEHNQVGKSDCFNISFTDKNNITLDNAFPLKESDALNLIPYEFSIENVCNHSASYEVNLEVLDGTTLDLNTIRVKLNNNDSIILDDLKSSDINVLKNTISSKNLAIGSLSGGEKKSFTLKLWLDENVTIDEASNKKFASKIVVNSSLNRNYITYNPVGGEVDSNEELLVDGKTTKLLKPTKDGYQFMGWYDSEEGGNKVSSDTIFQNQTTIYARWKQNPYTITYNLNGGVANNPSSYNEDSSFTLNIPKKEGYTFTSWDEYVVDLNWHKGWVDYNTGETGWRKEGQLLEVNSDYPNAMYSDLISIKNGDRVFVINYDGFSNGHTRVRVYDKDKNYIENGGNETYTATQDGYIRVLYVQESSESQRSGAKVRLSLAKENVIISPNTMGNRKYVANYELNLIEKEYDSGTLNSYRKTYLTKNEYMNLLEFDTNPITPTSMDLKFICGNRVSDISSDCTFDVDGYSDDGWENIVTKTGNRDRKNLSTTIFEGTENLSFEKKYTKFRINFKSYDEQIYLYSKIGIYY